MSARRKEFPRKKQTLSVWLSSLWYTGTSSIPPFSVGVTVIKLQFDYMRTGSIEDARWKVPTTTVRSKRELRDDLSRGMGWLYPSTPVRLNVEQSRNTWPMKEINEKAQWFLRWYFSWLSIIPRLLTIENHRIRRASLETFPASRFPLHIHYRSKY